MRKESPLYEMIENCSDAVLERYGKGPCYRIDKAGKWLDLDYSFILHERRIVDDEVQEEIRLRLSSLDKNRLPVCISETVLNINEYRFPNLMHSQKAANYRNDRLLKIAARLMPDLTA